MTFDPPAARSALVLVLQRRRSRDAPWDRADLALLRRNLRRLPGQVDPRALALVAPHCGSACEAQDAALLTACLWAVWHREFMPADSAWNLGYALRAMPNPAGDRAWRSLCTTTDATLPPRMAAIVGALAEHGVAIDWHRLHRDLRSWYQGFHHLVLRRWFTGLYGPTPAADRRTGAPPARLIPAPPDGAPRGAVPPPPSPSELTS